MPCALMPQQSGFSLPMIRLQISTTLRSHLLLLTVRSGKVRPVRRTTEQPINRQASTATNNADVMSADSDMSGRSGIKVGQPNPD